MKRIGMLFVMVMLVVGLTAGCSLKNLVTGDATLADCAAIQAYITMCNTELLKQTIPQNTRQWFELALAGAQIELARKCAGVVQ